MTREEFLATLESLGLSLKQFAAITKQHLSTVYGWGTVRARGGQDTREERLQAVPGWVPPLLRAWDAAPKRLLREEIKAVTVT